MHKVRHGYIHHSSHMLHVRDVMIIICFLVQQLVLPCIGYDNNTSKGVFFIFGDSLADVGNNDYLPLSSFKANFIPNGVDLPGKGPTGRFCNGRLVLDEVASNLGYPISVPYLSPFSRGVVASQGTNYASGGCGILNETSSNSNGCLSLWTQLNYHDRTVGSLVKDLGIDKAQELLQASLYFVLIGSNDFLGNYLKNASKGYSPPQFNELLVSKLSAHLTRLYNQSARRIAVFGVGPLGCIPRERVKSSNGSCDDHLNSWVLSLNQAVRSLLATDLSAALPGAKLTFADPYPTIMDMIQNPATYGFEVVAEACCGGGRMRAQVACLPLSFTYCPKRDAYLFWDAWHPTQAANVQLAKSLLASSSNEVHPWTFQQLLT